MIDAYDGLNDDAMMDLMYVVIYDVLKCIRGRGGKSEERTMHKAVPCLYTYTCIYRYYEQVSMPVYSTLSVSESACETYAQ